MATAAALDLPNLSSVEIENPNGWLNCLKQFTSSRKDTFSFEEWTLQNRQKFTEQILDIIHDSTDHLEHQEILIECLYALVIMSRDAPSVQVVFNTRKTWDNLTLLAGLRSFTTEEETSTGPFHESIVISCLKCLSNLIFITKDENKFCNSTGFPQCIMKKLSMHDSQSSSDIEFLLVRLIFLITAFNDDARLTMVGQYHGRKVLIDLLSKKLLHCKQSNSKSTLSRAFLPQNHVKSCCETFKALFNMNIKLHDSKPSESDALQVDETISVCRKFLLTTIPGDDAHSSRLHVDVQNCLYSVVTSYFNEVKFVPTVCDVPSDGIFSYTGADLAKYEDRDLSAVLVILKQLEHKVNSQQFSTGYIVPVLSLLSLISRQSRIIRKYCKNYVIPPRKDFKHRPELGSKFRNRLIKLFTHPSIEIKGAAADFLFVLCKEDVDRLIKHTGYGNAAGLLANRGLLAGGKGSTIYSDTDSDSDTEEYLENADKINPVTGHIPPKMPDPMANMSDEQKEYLAVQLANQLSKLSDNDVMKPVCVDPTTGKLVSIQQRVHETVLPEEKESDDDSD